MDDPKRYLTSAPKIEQRRLTDEQAAEVKLWMQRLFGPDGTKWRVDKDYHRWALKNSDWILGGPMNVSYDEHLKELHEEVKRELGRS